jgi:hypothetical protein
MNQKKIEQILEKILQSNEFQGSDNYHKLLKYLTDKSMSGVSPKESTIAFEVFDKDISSESLDSSSVRVYIHNLRQKLDSYYLNEGKNDDIRLKIPKGHYLVKFESASTENKKDNSKKLIIANLILLVIIIVSIFLFIFNFDQITKGHVDQSINSIIWNDYIYDVKPILLVFGDYYLYEDLALNRIRYVRDFQINSAEDFEEFVSDHPELSKTYRSTSHTLFGKFVLNCLSDLNSFFISQGKKINITLGSNLQWEDLNRNNVVFVGSFKTLRLFKNLLNNHHFEYIIHPNTLNFHDTQKDSTYSYQSPKNHTTGQVKDYAIFSRFLGPNNNIITIFSSTHDVGHISTVRYFTEAGNLENFETTYLKDKENDYYFDALFEVLGFSRTGFQPKLLHMAWIE